MKTAGVILAASAAFTSVVASPAKFQYRASSNTPQVTTKGNAFFAGDKRFYIRGVDYQPGGSSNVADPIADANGCKRDVEKFKDLGINTVRVYTVDNTADHDECMSALSDAGIYLALDVNTPKYSLRRDKPSPSYNEVYLQNIFATIDVFQKYDNTLLFFSGNEVINDDATTDTAPYIKAVTRDMKSYISSRGYRKIPVGYSAADVEENRESTAEYMNCGTDDERSDFFAFNDYSWCDPSSFTTSGWDQKVKTYSNYSIPLFLSEYGCITNTREFNEIASLYGDDMKAVYSGGLVYEYSYEESNKGYGLVEIDGSSVKELDDYKTLKDKLAKTPAPSDDGGYKSDGSASECPAKSDHWNVDSDALPALPDKAKAYMEKGAGSGAGLTGSGSQESGPDTHPTADPGSGTGTVGGDSSNASNSAGAASSLRIPEITATPFVCGAVLLVSTLFGASLI
ncbi:beta-glucanosyltransferase [Pseudovirgaria hyperparasitica]|uniref:1,3-beta-glucanosyltransferase n=1 Tax=Pseudovirgaria hyperparasitica TaxID=470096 RepID=A0A6A6W9P2_9PEZI|nr:beta-glucanosyltransferase [Pseudovirgaria hyperparasitica]KAF2758879.1 beta-glucanosyltransferase [Pseudovirgaria hyperparasitica]